MIEEWRPAAGWEGFYEVSTLGEVRSAARTVPHKRYGAMTLRRRWMAQVTTSQGYRTVTLSRDGKHLVVRVHVLVLETFVGPRPEGHDGCHNDGDPEHNDLSNLRWDTRSANVRDQVAHGTHSVANRTHCPQGHQYTTANTERKKGNRRVCKTCKAAYRQHYWFEHSA